MIRHVIVCDWSSSPIPEISVEVLQHLIGLSKDASLYFFYQQSFPEGNSREFYDFFSYFRRFDSLERIARQNIQCNATIKLVSIPPSEKKSYSINTQFFKILKSILLQNPSVPLRLLLSKYLLNDVPLGTAIASSTISVFKDKDINYINAHSFIDILLQECEERYLFFANSNIFSNESHIYLFNGRFASCKTIESAAALYQTNISYYERSFSLYSFTLRNHMPHDRLKINNEINLVWSSALDKDVASSIGHTYFLQKLSGHGINWHSFSKPLSSDSQQSFKQNQSTVITYFTSSEDEFEALGSLWRTSDFLSSQFDIIKELSRICHDNKWKLQIRLHPNHDVASTRSKVQWSSILQRLYPDQEIIPPSADCSSYDLIMQSTCIICYGSTIGVEAMYMEKPVVLCGPSFYQFLSDKLIVAKSFYDLDSSIKIALAYNKSDCSRLKHDSLKYGYWVYMQGFPFSIYSPSTPLEGKIFGKYIGFTHSVLSKLKQFLHF